MFCYFRDPDFKSAFDQFAKKINHLTAEAKKKRKKCWFFDLLSLFFFFFFFFFLCFFRCKHFHAISILFIVHVSLYHVDVPKNDFLLSIVHLIEQFGASCPFDTIKKDLLWFSLHHFFLSVSLCFQILLLDLKKITESKLKKRSTHWGPPISGSISIL